jgi:long-subunit fatty acid transport protein
VNRLKAVTGVLCAVVALWPCAVVASDGIEPMASSMRALARGGADVAVGDTAMSQFENPASLSLQPRTGLRIDGTGEMAFLDMPWRGAFGTANTDRAVVPLANTAASIPINDRLTLGMGFNTKAGLATSYTQRHLLIPFMTRHVGSDLKVLNFPLSVAYKINDKLSIGAGARLEYTTARFDTVLGPADVEFGRGETLGGGFNFGLVYRPREDLTFGLGYRSPTWAGDLEGGNGKASLLGVLPVPLGNIGIDSLRLPQKISAGAAWDITKRLKLASEVRWINYSNCSLNSMTIQTDGLVDVRLALPLGYEDVWAFMLGPQYQLSEHWKVACGYHYSNPAVSADHLLPEGTVATRHHATTGIWYETKHWWMGLAYSMAFPESLHGSGRSAIPLGIDYANASISNMQQAVALGFGYQW